MTRTVVIGGGYVGLTTAACLATLGNRVTVVENDVSKLDGLNDARVPVREPLLDELIHNGLRGGLLSFTSDYEQAIRTAAVVFVAVNTPAGPHGQADTRFFNLAVNSAAPHLKRGTTLAIKSTVPPGTADSVAEVLKAKHVKVVSNPEFLRQGSAVDCFLHPERIVIGAPDQSDAVALVRLYKPLGAPIFVTSRRSAEVAKYAANSYLALRISFINEIAGICEAVDADVQEVARVVGSDGRIGPAFLNAGIGWGGSCFPKDVLALSAVAKARGAPNDILEATYEVNARQRARAVEHIAGALSYRRDPTVAVLGLAFKPGTDDVRGSPALEIVAHLLEEGFHVRAHDPAAMANAARALPNIQYCADPYDAADGAHAILLATECPEYVQIDWRRLRRIMTGNLVVDGRNALDPDLMTALGFVYRGFGRSASPAKQPASVRSPESRRHHGHPLQRRLRTGETSA